MFLIKWSDRLSKFLMVLAALWAFVLTFIIMSDIIGRGAFNSPVYGVREIVMNSIVIIVFLQAGYAIRSRSMLKADFLVDHFPPLAKKIALAVGYLLGAGFFLTVVIGSIDSAIFFANELEKEGLPAKEVLNLVLDSAEKHGYKWPVRYVIK